jgi:hypothetical protein
MVNLKIEYQIPEYLPMWGKKVRVYYHGISSFCTNCYGVGHPRNECKQKSSTWTDYINYLVGTGIPSRIFGSWLSSNLSTTRESEKDVPQPHFGDGNDDSDSDEYDINNIPPKMLKLFKKMQASTPKSMAKKSTQKPKKDKKESAVNVRGRVSRGRGASTSRGRGKN